MSRLHGSPFAMIPEWLLDSEISDRAVRVWCVLSRHASTEGKAWPGRPKLAERLGCSLASLDRAIAELVDAGAVSVEAHHRPDGSRATNSYWMWPATPSSPVRTPPLTREGPPSSPVQVPLLTGEEAIRNESQRNESQKGKILRPPDDERTDQQLITDAFTAFWKAYPRKTAKGEARKAWPRAIKAAGGDLGKIVGGVRRYAADPNLPEPQFIPHPASWLNGERWDDEPLPPRAANGHRPASSAQSVFQVVGSDGFLIE